MKAQENNARRARASCAVRLNVTLALAICAAVAGCRFDDGGFTTEVVDVNAALPPKSATLLKAADAAQANGDQAGAAVLYGEVVKEHPESAKAKTALAQSMLAQGDPALALRYFQEAMKLDPSAVENYIGAGQAYMSKQQPLMAQKQFKIAVEKDPKNLKALNGLAVSLDATQSHDLAQTYYRKALELAPGDQAIRNNYGLSLALSGRHSEAVAELTPLSKVEGEVGRKARQNLSLSYAMQGDMDNAVRWALVDQKPDEVRHDLMVYGSTVVK